MRERNGLNAGRKQGESPAVLRREWGHRGEEGRDWEYVYVCGISCAWCEMNMGKKGTHGGSDTHCTLTHTNQHNRPRQRAKSRNKPQPPIPEGQGEAGGSPQTESTTEMRLDKSSRRHVSVVRSFVFFFFSLSLYGRRDVHASGGRRVWSSPLPVLASSGLDCVPSPCCFSCPVFFSQSLLSFSPFASLCGTVLRHALCSSLPPLPVMPSSPPPYRSAYGPDRPSPSVPLPLPWLQARHLTHYSPRTCLTFIQTPNPFFPVSPTPITHQSLTPVSVLSLSLEGCAVSRAVPTPLV